MGTLICAISQQPVAAGQYLYGKDLRQSLREFIARDYPDFGLQSVISTDALNVYRKRYLEHLIESELGEVSALEREVVDSIAQNQTLSENIELQLHEQTTLGQRIADGIAEFGGSWTFIICFFSFLILWMLTNILFLSSNPFDPYPFILLNLILSCLAAIQAPIIMMSQNRQEEKDRQRSEHDYKINLKAELEIRLLHEKIDHLIVHQNRRLIEIQELQTDYLEDILKEVKNKKAE